MFTVCTNLFPNDSNRGCSIGAASAFFVFRQLVLPSLNSLPSPAQPSARSVPGPALVFSPSLNPRPGPPNLAPLNSRPGTALAFYALAQLPARPTSRRSIPLPALLLLFSPSLDSPPCPCLCFFRSRSTRHPVPAFAFFALAQLPGRPTSRRSISVPALPLLFPLARRSLSALFPPLESGRSLRGTLAGLRRRRLRPARLQEPELRVPMYDFAPGRFFACQFASVGRVLAAPGRVSKFAPPIRLGGGLYRDSRTCRVLRSFLFGTKPAEEQHRKMRASAGQRLRPAGSCGAQFLGDCRVFAVGRLRLS